MRRIRNLLVMSLVVGLGASPVVAGGTAKKAAPAKKAPAKTPAKTAAAKPAPVKKAAPAPMVNAEQKKAFINQMGGFKLGMTKDEILAVLQKQIAERFEEKIKATTDVAQQDRFRKDKKAELARIAGTYVKFDGSPTGWDVSIIEGEFAHKTNEAMMERWENDNGKNNRRFFFFYNDKLWKMFVSLDVSMIPEEKRNFDTFKSSMEGQYGKGAIDGGTISWRAGEFDARAIDKFRDYGALGLVVEDPKIRTEVLALREQMAPPKATTPSVINAVIDKDGKDHPDVKSNGGAVDAVIQAHGGTPPRRN